MPQKTRMTEQPPAQAADLQADGRPLNVLGEGRFGEVPSQLRRLVAGDGGAAAWLYDTFAAGLYRRLERRYGYPGGLDVENLLHDAFVFYFQRDCKVMRDFLARVPAAAQTRPALDRHLWDLACGVASNQLRSAARRYQRPLADIDAVRHAPSGERSALDRDAVERLGECLRESDEEVYLYGKLRFWEGLTPAEICEVTGWARKATYKLRQAFDDLARRCAESLGLAPGAAP